MTNIIQRYSAYWQTTVIEILCALNTRITQHDYRRHLVIQYPPDPQFGDIAIPLFALAPLLKTDPQKLAETICAKIDAQGADTQWGAVTGVKGYLNIHLPRPQFIARLLSDIQTDVPKSAIHSPVTAKKYCIEFSSPNTNKPLHLGHLRNNVLGESIARLLAYCGAQVKKINLINDRGIHICKSMAAYAKYGEGHTPRSSGIKSDHFVGNYYVRYMRWERDSPEEAQRSARTLLHEWEADKRETRALWSTMREWVLSGISATYRRTGIQFDELQFESDTYLTGKEIVHTGIARGIFHKAADGSIEIDLTDVGLDTKKLLRSDGTAIYITQDLGNAAMRYRAWKFDTLLYVVASEQDYHFRVLFEIIKRLDLPYAHALYHRSYGMVNLPDGKMKSREGTVVDADTLLDDVRNAVLQQMRTQQSSPAEDAATAEKIALASIHYWLLRVEPHKDINFDVKQSISFTGNSGVYLLYVITRMHHLIAEAHTRYGKGVPEISHDDIGAHLSHPLEWQLIAALHQFDITVVEAAQSYNPLHVAVFLYKTAQIFSTYYHAVKIAVEEQHALRQSRICLIQKLLHLFETGCALLVMPTVTAM